MPLQPPTKISVPINIDVADQVESPRAEIVQQLRELVARHRELRSQLGQLSGDNPVRPQLLVESVELQSQIERLTLEAMQLEQPEVTFVETSPAPFVLPHIPGDYFALGIVLILSTILPMSIALAVRFLRRGMPAKAVAAAPDLAQRVNRIEQIVEATAIEVERIGEGQRFVTQVMGEHIAVLREASKSAALVEQDRMRAVQRQVTPH